MGEADEAEPSKNLNVWGGGLVFQVFDMPAKMRGSGLKTELLTFRVTASVKEAVVHVAHGDGMDVSEWLRSLVISELRRRGVLPAFNCSEADGGEKQS